MEGLLKYDGGLLGYKADSIRLKEGMDYTLSFSTYPAFLCAFRDTMMTSAVGVFVLNVEGGEAAMHTLTPICDQIARYIDFTYDNSGGARDIKLHCKKTCNLTYIQLI